MLVFYCRKIKKKSLFGKWKFSVDEARWKENSEIFDKGVDDSAFDSLREGINLFIKKI